MHKPSFYINLNGLCGRYKKQATICFQFLKCSKKGLFEDVNFDFFFSLTFNSSTFQSHPTKLFDSYKLYFGRFIFQASVETLGSSS